MELILSFLTDLFDSGAGYSTINTARSALSTFLSKDNTPVGQLPIICRFVKGVFNLRPAIPKTKRIWDVSIVLNHLRKLAPVHSLNLETLTLKTIMLIALLSGQRRQTLGLISLRNITVTNDLITISFGDLLKQSRPGFQLKDISVKAYPVDRRLCPCRYLQEYIKRTKSLRKDQILFISWIKPHRAVSEDTLSRWLKSVLNDAGIDLTRFSAHSIRAASSSAASAANVPINTILDCAGWSNCGTFRKYYKKSIENTGVFARALLHHAEQRQ